MKARVFCPGIFLAILSLFFNVSAVVAESTWTISLNNFQFSPKRLTIKKNDTVKWTHNQAGSMPHDIDADDGKSFASPDLFYGQSFKKKFKKVGTYLYHCNFHGAKGGIGMAGRIVVKEK